MNGQKQYPLERTNIGSTVSTVYIQGLAKMPHLRLLSPSLSRLLYRYLRSNSVLYSLWGRIVRYNMHRANGAFFLLACLCLSAENKIVIMHFPTFEHLA